MLAKIAAGHSPYATFSLHLSTTMIGGCVQGRLCQDRTGSSLLEDQCRAVALIPNQMNRTGFDKVHAVHMVSKLEDMLTGAVQLRLRLHAIEKRPNLM